MVFFFPLFLMVALIQMSPFLYLYLPLLMFFFNCGKKKTPHKLFIYLLNKCLSVQDSTVNYKHMLYSRSLEHVFIL